MGLIACIEGDLKPEGNSAVAVVNVTAPGVRLKGLKPWFYYFFPLWPWQCIPPAPCFSSFKKKMITVSTSMSCYENCYVSPKMCWDIMVAFIVAVNILMILRPDMVCCILNFQPYCLCLLEFKLQPHSPVYCLHDSCLDLYCVRKSWDLFPSSLERGLTTGFKRLSIDGSWNCIPYFKTKPWFYLVSLESPLLEGNCTFFLTNLLSFPWG